MDDYRLAPILDDTSLFGQHGQDILSLDLPPIQEPVFTKQPGNECTLDQPHTPIRNDFSLEAAIAETTSSSSRKRQHEGSVAQSTLPLAKVLNREQATTCKEARESLQECILGVPQSFQLPHPNVPHHADTVGLGLPPLLQGLHDPPPHAGLFPRITGESDSIQSPQVLSRIQHLKSARILHDSHQEATNTVNPAEQPECTSKASGGSTGAPKKKVKKAKSPSQLGSRQNKKWTKDETLDLLRGVARHGRGNWKEILHDTDLHFGGRTHIDLKDRYRVCCTGKAASLPSIDALDAAVASKAVSASEPPDNSAASRKAGRSDEASKPSIEEVSEALGETSNEALRQQHNNRKPRKPFSEVEDSAILQGYEKYGSQFAKILLAPELQKTERSRGDIRDRWRILSKRSKAQALLTVIKDRDTTEQSLNASMKLDRVVDPVIDFAGQSQRQDIEIHHSQVEHLAFIDPTITWKPTVVTHT